MTPPHPILLTFDIFGTVIDWRSGLREALFTHGYQMSDSEFDRIIDVQGRIESGPFRRYSEITALSLIEVLGVEPKTAHQIGERVGHWALYPDSKDGLARLTHVAPCAAMTNSDRMHGEQFQKRLGFPLSHWICAEEVGIYKPSPEFWHRVSSRLKIPPGPHWWHVSAYADYDLQAAKQLGLTCIFVKRPHARAGSSDFKVETLVELAEHLESKTMEIHK